MDQTVRDGKRNFAAGDVAVGSERLPAEAVRARGQAGGVRGQRVRGRILGEFKRSRSAVGMKQG